MDGVLVSSDKVDASINFVWGNVGEGLKKLDEIRMLCLAEQNPNHSLSVITNIEIEKLIKEIFESPNEIGFFTNEIKNKIVELNKKDVTFREIAKFFKQTNDMLSIGSTITGNIQSQKLPMRYEYPEENKI
jgi:hypothetical protein